VKRTYNRLPPGLRPAFTALVMGPRILLGFAKAAALGRPLGYIRQWTDYKRSRGMSRWHDIVDWIGGYPFEVAKPEEVFGFLQERGFQLDRLQTCAGGNGCNQYVFSRVQQPG
jgi:2-polyprenyl-6-hydroxyphenyl methylase/3-demethylubiquinone-9 3-methyltransferase